MGGDITSSAIPAVEFCVVMSICGGRGGDVSECGGYGVSMNMGEVCY